MSGTAAPAAPDVSLIVAAYNAARTLPALMDSIEAADQAAGVAWEAVLVDNASTDATPELLRDFAARSKVPVTVLREARQGLSAARNAGLRAARGRLLAITDSDCVIAPDYVASIVREFAADPELGLLGGRVELYNPADLPVSIRTSRVRTPVTTDALNFSDVPGCNTVFTRALIDEIGPYDIRLGFGTRCGPSEDIDLTYRAARSGRRVIYTPDVVVYHNHGRSTEAQLRATQESYAVGKGVFFAKYALRLHRPILKAAYWEIAAQAKELRRPGPADESSLGAGAILTAMMRGAWLALTDEMLKPFAR